MQRNYCTFIIATIITFIMSTSCFARVCFLANGKLCDDDGTASNNIYECSGSNCSTICDNTLTFSKNQYTEDAIKDYAAQRGYEYKGSINVSKDGKSESCYQLGCKDDLTSLSACENKYGKECCLMTENNYCYKKCSLCATNRIGRAYYPYNDDSLKSCSFIDNAGMSPYTNSSGVVLGYRINAFSQLLMLADNDEEIVSDDGDDTIGTPWKEEKVWKCDNDCLCEKISECENLSTQIVNGSTVKGVYCKQGTRYSLYGKCHVPAPESGVSIIGNKLYCSRNCMICNEIRGYYADADKCQALNDGRGCGISHGYSDFKESDCYFITGNCKKFTNDYYTFDKEGTSIANACRPIPADGVQDPKKRFVYSGSETEKCYYCACQGSDVNVNTCNWLSCNAAVYASHSSSEETCDTMGYDLSRTSVNQSVSDYICSACPFDATKWKCVRKYD